LIRSVKSPECWVWQTDSWLPQRTIIIIIIIIV